MSTTKIMSFNHVFTFTTALRKGASSMKPVSTWKRSTKIKWYRTTEDNV